MSIIKDKPLTLSKEIKKYDTKVLIKFLQKEDLRLDKEDLEIIHK